MKFYLLKFLVIFVSMICCFKDLEASDQQQSLLPLKKLTVGAYDNYNGFVSKDSQWLYYTESKFLANQIRRMNLNSGLSSDVIDIHSDSKSAVISPDGKYIAFTYFLHDAKGDVCYRQIKGEQVFCFSKNNVTDHSPFWLSETSLGSVSSSDINNTSVVWAYDIVSKKKKLLLKGKRISMPRVSPNGRLLVFRSDSRQISVFDLQKNKLLRTLDISIPIEIGNTYFGSDGRFVYFTGYSLDSNRDLIIDGRDSAAIYRVDLENDASLHVPQQLVTTDKNCSYPFVNKDSIYPTCDFAGSLDIYKLPKDGAIPVSWLEKDLLEAHQSVRSYADRMLLLNAMYTRHAMFDQKVLLQRSAVNLALMGEWLALSRFLFSLSELSETSDRDYLVQSQVFKFLAEWELYQDKSLALNLRSNLEKLYVQLSSGRRLVKDKELFLAYLHFMLGDHESAKNLLLDYSPTGQLNHVLSNQLHRSIFTEPGERMTFLKTRFLNSKDQKENRLFYLMELLDLVSRQQDRERERAIDGLLDACSSEDELITVIQGEALIYAILTSQDNKEEIKSYQKLAKLLRTVPGQYFVSRSLFSRAVLLFNRYDKTRRLTDVVGLWQEFVDKKGKEWPFVMDAYTESTIDTAYGYLHDRNGQEKYAKGAFFYNLRIGDDLEGHFQFARLSMSEKDHAFLLKNYEQMIRQGLIAADASEFALLSQKLVKNRWIDWPRNEIENAIVQLQAIQDNRRGVGLKYLMMGYFNHIKFLQSRDGYAYDRIAANEAIRNYLLAIDLSWNNARIRAAAYENLGLLHFSTRNYTLAAQYLAERSESGFDDEHRQIAFVWYYSAALYRAGRAKDAAEWMKKLVGFFKEGFIPFAAILDRVAFYSMVAQEFEQAAGFYEKLVTLADSDQAFLEPGVMLSYAYCLSKLNKRSEANTWLRRAIKASNFSDSQPIGAKHEFNEDKLRQLEKISFISWGLLAQSSDDHLEKADALVQRITYYEAFYKDPSAYQFNKADLYEQELKDTQRLAYLHYEQSSDSSLSIDLFARSLGLVENNGESLGYLSKPIIQGIKNILFFSQWSSPTFGDHRIDRESLSEVLAAASEEWKKDQRPSLSSGLSYGELILLYESFQIDLPKSRLDSVDVIDPYLQKSDQVISAVCERLEDSGVKDSAIVRQKLKSYRDAIVVLRK